MSESESFIHEVSEEVRRDRLFAFFKKYLWVFVALVLLIVGGTVFNEYRKAQTQNAAIAVGEELAAAQEARDAAGFAALAQQDIPAAVLAKMEQATALANDGQTGAAVDLLQGMATDGDVPPIYKDLALLKSLMIGGSTMEEREALDIIDRLSTPGAPFRLLAIEQRAVLHLQNGNAEAALADLAEIIADPEASEGLRNRAQELTIALGGELPGANLTTDG